ncbi:MAG: 50S ribosomal protein L4 [Patescibacteria group bacterium]
MADATLTIPVYNADGKQTSEVTLDSRIFGQKPDAGLLHLVTVQQQANKRLGLAHTKTKAEVRGGGRKPWKQKGTGQARQGSIRSPQWRGGGVIFGPRTGRNWTGKLNVQVRRKALAMALSVKAEAKQIRLVESLPTDGKTKPVVALLKNTNADRTPLLIPATHDSMIVRATRNLQRVTVLRADSLNAYDVLRSHRLVLPVASLAVIAKTYFSPAKKQK